jgi:hypothetical protein
MMPAGEAESICIIAAAHAAWPRLRMSAAERRLFTRRSLLKQCKE